MVPNKNEVSQAIKRVRLWYGLLLLVLMVFGVRLFYIQVIRYDHYHAAALSDQLKQYQIPATRGIIEAHDGGNVLPIVLNQQLYTLYADPVYIKNASQDAAKLQKIIGGDASQYAQLMQTKNSRYAVLGKKLAGDQANQIAALKLPGIGTQAQDYRTYPQGSLASQVLGFVNNDGTGEYGIEQALNKQLSGKPGQVKAVTDASGVPLAASKDNVETAPQNGNNVVTTIDLPMQARMEQILQQEYQKTKSQGLSAIIMDPNTGQIKAMANYPTYDPSNYQDVSDPSLFQNAAVTNAIEPGSTMKVMTVAASLDQGIITPNTTFYDPAHWLVDGFDITDIEEDGGPRVQSIGSLLNLSLNTGATWLLMQMGGGQINDKARNTWYNYMTNHFRLGQATGVEQGYEPNGLVPSPQDNGAGINLTYANTAFGQAVQITALQMAAADSAVLNGGTYYQPTLVDQLVDSSGHAMPNKPKVLKAHVVAPKVSQEMLPLMQYVVEQHLQEGFGYLNFDQSNYTVGGKTGTAQVAKPGGGYYDNKFNGTYVGFVGGNKPQYVIVVFNILPNVAGYAGSYGGQPVFADLAHMLIDNSYVTPKSQ
ncbi:MAG TPA: penicillin-binding protein 2 [Candidatus Saccharimonadales bacterium]|jgi:cell division protein FtsI/penicillin-binding protein 2|nr:penicillin-binding protein 2 [Candidatus Saccharimonadales bacterium]